MRAKEKETQFLFVYGTLRRHQKHEVSQILSRDGDYVGAAYFQGRLYVVDDFPGATLSSRSGDLVRGEVYRLRHPAKTFEQIDRYEEYNPARPEESLYVRRELPVTLQNGERLTAWVYLYNRPTKQLTPIRSGDFLEYQRLSGTRS